MKKYTRTQYYGLIAGVLLSSSVQADAVSMEDMGKALLQQAIGGEANTAETKATSAETAQAVEKSAKASQLGAGLSSMQLSGGVKDVLSIGTEKAIKMLGQEGGFSNNPALKIGIPDSMKSIEKALRSAGQGKRVDDAIATMNKAAEQAIPEAAEVFNETIKAMSVTDAMGLINGPENSLTEYFQKNSSEALKQRILPIITKATASTGATAAYKQLTAKMGNLDVNKMAGLGDLGALGKAVGIELPATVDLDAYVTDKALEGLFKTLSEQEANIRKGGAAAQATDLLKKIFGTQ
ncbi:DUF4197 domain-containing protein [Candidatus Venteria ishoeyi]|uniref:DUF4197 domain-containing protein n=1 Tax=Candidatus Venteria ishoeyi TaxID=1899563 RepID=UPI0025A59AB8|nr:DUF4197 domain-containing protein [Candidatus Venteria ishoeyi]MDM8545074.1 DUF4197 domain-containing protein [Candidatus Venteria ishoeyi]